MARGRQGNEKKNSMHRNHGTSCSAQSQGSNVGYNGSGKRVYSGIRPVPPDAEQARIKTKKRSAGSELQKFWGAARATGELCGNMVETA